ncbi:MAG TPA: expansin EXLX1 family cellulose-binding protein [Chloroflexaceae bacterium]|nr:expansin EXLX1 family cellulose-binding protein [Chloroflexaceae bacterium]
MMNLVRIAMLALALAGALGASSIAIGQAQQRRAFLPMVVTTGSSQPGTPDTPVLTGEATYYWEANGDGSCMFGPSPDDLMVAALAYHNYSDPGPAAWCGAYVEVKGPDATIVVRIVDKCPDVYVPPDRGCNVNHLDLSPQAFGKIAAMERGRVPITWRVISPELTGPIAYHFKDGSNQWWTAVQVRNHRNPVATLEYRNGAGQWVQVPRTDYNFFVRESGMGPGPYTFRVTDIYGNQLIDSGIRHAENATIPGSAQFPPGP